MLLRQRIERMIKLVKTLKNPDERRNFLLSKLTLKNFIVFGLVTNVLSSLVLISYYNDSYINLSLTRLISRISGRIGDWVLPSFLRSHLLNAYISLYDVNRDEILDPVLENYKTVKEFFIRQIKVTFYFF